MNVQSNHDCSFHSSIAFFGFREIVSPKFIRKNIVSEYEKTFTFIYDLNALNQQFEGNKNSVGTLIHWEESYIFTEFIERTFSLDYNFCNFDQ